MDLMAEIFAMLSACFTGVAYLLVGMEMTYPKTQKCDKKFYKCIKCFKCGKCHKKKKRKAKTNSESNSDSEHKHSDTKKNIIVIDTKEPIVIDTKEPIVENVVMTKIKYNTFVETEV